MTLKTIVDHTINDKAYETDMDVRKKIASRMIDRDYPIAEIAKITGLSIAQVETLK